MIQANELRVGNWVNCKIYNGNSNVNIQFVFQEAKYIHLFNPIQLTPEILEKCGFKEIYNRSIMRTYTYDGERLITKSNGFYMVGVLPEMKYLHQLQNAFYAILGKELEISL